MLIPVKLDKLDIKIIFTHFPKNISHKDSQNPKDPGDSESFHYDYK